MENIKTYEDACAHLQLDPTSLPDFSSAPENHRKALLAHYKLVIINQALNNGWKPDWSNTDERKWYPWFVMKAGFGFSSPAYVTWFSRTGVGSRLCFQTEALAEYAGKTFESLYQEYFTL